MIKQPAQQPSETAIEPEVVEPPSNAIRIAPTTKVTTPDIRKIRYYFPTGGGVLMRTCTLSSRDEYHIYFGRNLNTSRY